MSQTRRTFIKGSALTSTAVILGTSEIIGLQAENVSGTDNSGSRCPFFDQPLMCGGPDKSNRYMCESR